MTDEQMDRLAQVILAHGNNLADNLVLLKRFTERLQQDQHEFLAEQRSLSDQAQRKAASAATWSAVAAGAAALATIVLAVDAYLTP